MAKYTKKQKEAYAAQMRANPTFTERLMWEYIREGQCGADFKPQVVTPCGWIADFLCEDPKLIIEIDGAPHEGQEEKDATRDAAHAKKGYATLRIPSQRVMEESPNFFKAHVEEMTYQARTDTEVGPTWCLDLVDAVSQLGLPRSYDGLKRGREHWHSECRKLQAKAARLEDCVKTLAAALRQAIDIADESD